MSEIEKSRLKSIEAKDRFGLNGFAGKKVFTEADLPSKELLQLLLEGKKRNALAMYAWRNSLRALPFLTARLSIQEIWEKDTVKHVANVVRANVLLTLILREKQLDNVGFRAAARAYAARARAVRAAADAARADAAARAAADAAADAARAAARAYAADAAAYAADAAYAAAEAAVYSAARAAARAYAACTADAARAAPVASNAINDFNFLVEIDSPTALFKEALWRDQATDGEVTQLQTQFLDELGELGLGFLAEDIQKLWKGEQIDKVRLLRYANTEIGEDIWDNAKALEQFIVHGKKADNNAVRVMLVGPGGAGKTSLRDLILQRKTELFKTATKGVEHHNHQAVDIAQHKEALSEISDDEVRKKAEKLDLFLWDFGGQSIFHNLHRGFIRRENCVYVLVVDSRHEQAPDEWLAQIRMIIETNFSGVKESSPGEPEVPILIVTNSYEGIQRKQNQTRLLREFDGFLSEANFFEFPCISKKADESNELSDESEVSDVVLDAKFEDFMARLLTLASNTKAISELSGKAIKVLNKEMEQRSFIDYDTFVGRLEKAEIDAEERWEEIKNSLENLGRLVTVNGGEYCLDPGWIVDVAYNLINDDSILSSNGLVSRSTLLKRCRFWVNKLSGKEGARSTLIMNFLVEQSAAIQFENNKKSYYFFPDAAASNEPYGLNDLLNTHKQQAEKRSVSLEGKALEEIDVKITGKPLTIEYHFPSLPLGFRTKLVVDVHNNKDLRLSLPENVWRDGLRASYSNIDIWVDYQLAKQHITIRFFNYNNEAELARPLRLLHKIINEIAGFGTPILTQGFEHLGGEKTSALFKEIETFKQVKTSTSGGVTMNNPTFNEFSLFNFKKFIQNIKDSFRNISGSSVVAGENVQQENTESFNKKSDGQ